MKRKSDKLSAGIFLMLSQLLVMSLLSCGSLQRIRSKISTSSESMTHAREIQEQQLIRGIDWWKQGWMQELRYDVAFIESDSAIRYLPGQGFQLDGGSVLITLASMHDAGTAESRSALEKKSQGTEQIFLESKLSDETERHSEKERQPPNYTPWLALAGAAFAFILWFALYKRAQI